MDFVEKSLICAKYIFSVCEPQNLKGCANKNIFKIPFHIKIAP